MTSYYVYNPNKDKPRRLYSTYEKALENAKAVALLENSEVQVLKLVTSVGVKRELQIVEFEK